MFTKDPTLPVPAIPVASRRAVADGTRTVFAVPLRRHGRRIGRDANATALVVRRPPHVRDARFRWGGNGARAERRPVFLWGRCRACFGCRGCFGARLRLALVQPGGVWWASARHAQRKRVDVR